ncbi:pilus assembly protein [Rhizobium sp. TRM95111]|uniref:TadE/TadG family type IV pilus assembly protein n=1 Tax=Rhizobium alarense TaxID=2846851 RepID=UPI001F1E61AF|nr:TadE/TadG family type IV pilus assembly protein [Rhizobium alarense]MCF3642849.1 pilus assembly protein [Rhizobium alarense]
MADLHAERTMKGSGLARRFARRRDGATAIEFAILALPFFMIIFASIETFIAFAGEQLLANATDVMARKIRTGEITYNQGKSTDMTEAEFRTAFCEEISVFMTCSDTEVETPSKLFLDVRSFASIEDIPETVVPREGDETYGELDTSTFGFAPGGKQTVNIVRAYYNWTIMTDLIRPYLSNVRPAGASSDSFSYLMVAAAVIQNENYP